MTANITTVISKEHTEVQIIFAVYESVSAFNVGDGEQSLGHFEYYFVTVSSLQNPPVYFSHVSSRRYTCAEASSAPPVESLV